MPSAELLSELWNYAHTQDFRQGLFVEASGLVLDVLLLIVGVKIVSYYLVRQTRKTTTYASSFFVAQFLRDILLLQLKSGGVAEVNARLREALDKGVMKERFSHVLYGNTDNLMGAAQAKNEVWRAYRWPQGTHLGTAQEPIQRGRETC